MYIYIYIHIYVIDVLRRRLITEPCRYTGLLFGNLARRVLSLLTYYIYYNIISCHIILYHIISYHVILYITYDSNS